MEKDKAGMPSFGKKKCSAQVSRKVRMLNTLKEILRYVYFLNLF